MIRYQKDRQNIVTLIFDMDEERVNIINHQLAKAFVPVLEHLERESQAGNIRGVIICSAKNSFLAGGDLDYLHQAPNAQVVFEYAEDLRAIFRRIELLQVPVVAAINGAAMGSGYELALTCHRRIALDSPKTLIGLPEVRLGMMPGGGSIVRLTWMLGIEKAFEITTSGKPYHVKEALQKGLVDELVQTKAELMEAARTYINSKPKITKLWDEDDIPDAGDPRHPKTAKTILRLSAEMAKKNQENYPAIQAIFNVMVEGAMLSFDAARRIESRYFSSLVMSKECQHLTKAYWYDYNKLRNGLARPKGYGRFKLRKMGIIGAGEIGSGLAYTAALQGIEVLLRDMSVAIAMQGKDSVRRKLDKLITQGLLSQKQAQEVLDRISLTEDFQPFEDCDIIIESVFEHKELKARILRELDKYRQQESFLASNTSTLSISELGEAAGNIENYIGMHFFSPVSKSPLVELIRGKQSSDETLARAFDVVLQLGKIPIVVEDKPGFFVSRVVKAYLLEALALVEEGVAAVLIENLAKQMGMPIGPLALADDVGLDYFLSVESMMQKQHQRPKAPGFDVLKRMVQEFSRFGKSKNGGFYMYDQKKKMGLWPELKTLFVAKDLPHRDIQERLLFIQCLKTLQSIEEGRVQHNAEANLASILAWGFVPFKGGVLQYINDYGLPEFCKRAEELAQAYGPRFSPPQLLNDMCSRGENFS